MTAATAGQKPLQSPGRAPISVPDLVSGVLAGDRATMGRAITLVESRKPAHRPLAQEMLEALQPKAGNARRIGITGVPGVGKSTFIEHFGTMLTGLGHRVAVLAVDPTSSRTGGSIQGDKTRMQALKTAPSAPHPRRGRWWGGAGHAGDDPGRRWATTWCWWTVGVGQSETTVADAVDLFAVLMLPGAGDDLKAARRACARSPTCWWSTRPTGTTPNAWPCGRRLQGRIEYPDAGRPQLDAACPDRQRLDGGGPRRRLGERGGASPHRGSLGPLRRPPTNGRSTDARHGPGTARLLDDIPGLRARRTRLRPKLPPPTRRRRARR